MRSILVHVDTGKFRKLNKQKLTLGFTWLEIIERGILSTIVIERVKKKMVEEKQENKKSKEKKKNGKGKKKGKRKKKR